MKTTIALFAFAALTALPALAEDDVQITYRGQVRQVGTTTNAFAAHEMVFRLYEGKEDTEAAWTQTVADIPVDADGLFQVALRGDGLAGAIDGGKANWLGVTILTGLESGETPQEQYPRQALLAGPWAGRAARADALADSPAIGTVSAGTVEAKSLAPRQLQFKSLVLEPSAFADSAYGSIRLEGDGWSGKTLPVKGEVHFFSRRMRMGKDSLLTATYSASTGCTFGTADCNCAVLFRESTRDKTEYDRMPGMTLFFKQGETIALPPGLWLDGGDAPPIDAIVFPIGAD